MGALCLFGSEHSNLSEEKLALITLSILWYMMKQPLNSQSIFLPPAKMWTRFQSKFRKLSLGKISTILCRKYSIALENEILKNAKLYYLKDHRGDNGGWTSVILWFLCSEIQRHSTKEVSDVRANAMCLRQPPLLEGLASLFSIFSIILTGFSITTTYEQYVFAVNFKKWPHKRLLPGSFPKIDGGYYVRYQFQKERMHKACCPFFMEERTWFASLNNFKEEAVDSILIFLIDLVIYWFLPYHHRSHFIMRAQTDRSRWLKMAHGIGVRRGRVKMYR